MDINKYLLLIVAFGMFAGCHKHDCIPSKSFAFEGKLKKLIIYVENDDPPSDTTTMFFYYDSTSNKLTDIYYTIQDAIPQHQYHLNYLNKNLIELVVIQENDTLKYYAHIIDDNIIESFNTDIDLQSSLTEPTYAKFRNNKLDTLFMPDMIFYPLSGSCLGGPFEKKLLNMKLFDFKASSTGTLDSITYSVVSRFSDPCNTNTHIGQMYTTYTSYDNLGHQIPYQNRYSIIYTVENTLIQILNYAGYYFDKPFIKLVSSNYDNLFNNEFTQISYSYQFYSNKKVSQMTFYSQTTTTLKNVLKFEYY